MVESERTNLSIMLRKPRKKYSRLTIYVLGVAIIIAGILGHYLPDQTPVSDITMTPVEYIKLVEKKKQERLKRQAEEYRKQSELEKEEASN